MAKSFMEVLNEWKPAQLPVIQGTGVNIESAITMAKIKTKKPIAFLAKYDKDGFHLVALDETKKTYKDLEEVFFTHKEVEDYSNAICAAKRAEKITNPWVRASLGLD